MSKKQSTQLAIEISELRFSWDGHAPILKIECLQINRGERIFIEGPSGSGKSTLLSLIAGVIMPQNAGLAPFCHRPVSLSGCRAGTAVIVARLRANAGQHPARARGNAERPNQLAATGRSEHAGTLLARLPRGKQKASVVA